MRRWRSSSASAGSGQPVSVGLLGNACEVLPELLRRGVRPDAVTDQTSAHDPVNGYLPRGLVAARSGTGCGRENPAQVASAARASMARHVEAMLAFQKHGHPGIRLRQQHPPGRLR